jgi:hypothetical protein
MMKPFLPRKTSRLLIAIITCAGSAVAKRSFQQSGRVFLRGDGRLALGWLGYGYIGSRPKADHAMPFNLILKLEIEWPLIFEK